MNTPSSPVLALYLAEFLFGVLYAMLIHWLSVNDYLKGSTAYSVVVGDAMTLFLQWVFFQESWSPLVTFGSFVCSGTPMIVSYLVRHQQRVVSHHRRPWPTAALQAREDAVSMLDLLADQIADGDVSSASVVHRLHQVIGTLNSV